MTSTNKTKKWLIGLAIAVIFVSCAVVVVLLEHSPHRNPGNEIKETQCVLSENKTKYAVIFYSNDGTVLKVDSVAENLSATPPVDPAMTYGTVFKSWDTDFSKVVKDLEIYPICEEINGQTNVLAAQSRYAKKDSTVVVPVQLCGNVCVSGLEVTIRYDEELLNLTSVTEDKSVIFNDAVPGIVKLNYVSTQNTVSDVDICNLQFYVNGAEGEIPITIEINSIYAFEDGEISDTLFIPKSTVIDGKIFVVP